LEEHITSIFRVENNFQRYGKLKPSPTMPPYGTLHLVALVGTDISEERVAFIFRFVITLRCGKLENSFTFHVAYDGTIGDQGYPG
jgi:hypothetical protein